MSNDNEWRRKFARVVFLGNNLGQLPLAERDELNALLKEAYAELKTFPNRAAPVPIEELIAKSSLGAPFTEPDEAELDIAVAELKRIEALPESMNCYCSEYQSSGLPCPPGKCPNVPKGRTHYVLCPVHRGMMGRCSCHEIQAIMDRR